MSGTFPKVRFGLCDTCAHQRVVRSGRGSVFSMCERHFTDPRFRKYPPMPVVACPGHEPRDDGSAAAAGVPGGAGRP